MQVKHRINLGKKDDILEIDCMKYEGKGGEHTIIENNYDASKNKGETQ